jgi:hypothetical protein
MRGWCISSAVGFLFLCLGCAPIITVSANGTQKVNGEIPKQVTYAVFPAAEVEKDPKFADYSRLVAHKMNERGYKESELRTAKLAVYLAYTVKEASAPVAPGTGGSLEGSGGMGPGAGGYGTGATSTGVRLVKRYTSQAIIVVGDLPESRATGSLVELWRGEAATTGDNDLPQLLPVLVDAAFRHFGQTTHSPVQHTFSEEEMKNVRDVK